MKKIFYILATLLTISFFTNSSFADECSNSCLIQDAPADVLQEYIDNNRAIISNISSQLETQNSGNIVKQKSIKIYNSITNWSTFSTGIDFLKIQLSGEIPAPVKRDLELLKKEGENLAKFLKNMILQSSDNSIIDNACNGIQNCQLSGNAGDIVGRLIENHSNVLEFYKLSLLGKQSSFKGSFILADANFKSELNNNYNTYTLTDCSQCEGEFDKKIKEAITAISAQDQKSKDGIQQWKDAWSILNGSKNNTAEYAKLERDLLQGELSKQGIGGNNGETILNNLDKYNNNAYSNQNNPIDNTFSTIKDNIESNSNAVNFFSNIYRATKQLYKKGSGYLKGDTPTVPIGVLVEIDSNITSATSIMEAVDNSYQREVPFISAQDTNSDKLQSRIIHMHISLSQAINTLDKTIPFSEKVCNDQDKGNGKCSY
ncbi:hypothetical protein LR004_00325 [Candidatus Gracilibacteria bacterium]|nr:hypothetical protein [Candidatus Gracilibacteria bacterium]